MDSRDTAHIIKQYEPYVTRLFGNGSLAQGLIEKLTSILAEREPINTIPADIIRPEDLFDFNSSIVYQQRYPGFKIEDRTLDALFSIERNNDELNFKTMLYSQKTGKPISKNPVAGQYLAKITGFSPKGLSEFTNKRQIPLELAPEHRELQNELIRNRYNQCLPEKEKQELPAKEKLLTRLNIFACLKSCGLIWVLQHPTQLRNYIREMEFSDIRRRIKDYQENPCQYKYLDF